MARLVAAGCVVVGKTNTPELGWKPDTENPLFGATLNPWNLEHTAGGSSGGSAAAIASGMVPLATGSDGGGSLRIPSSACGLSGMKPSLGRVPSGGPAAAGLAEPVDQGPDGPAPVRPGGRPRGGGRSRSRPTCGRCPGPRRPGRPPCEDPHPPARVAWSPTLGYAEIDDEVLTLCQRAVDVLADLGTEVVEVDTVFDEDPVDSWLTLSGVYNLRTHHDLIGTEAWGQVDPVLRMIIEGAAATGPLDVVRAEDACHTLNLRLVDLFHDVRLLVTPDHGRRRRLRGRSAAPG